MKGIPVLRRASASFTLAIPLALGLTACAAPLPPPQPRMLAPSDEQLAGNYRAALDDYDAFLRANPDDPAADWVRATHVLLDRLLRSADAIERLQRELGARNDEVTQARKDLTALRRELTVQTEDLERLRRLKLRVEDLRKAHEDELLHAVNLLVAALAEASQSKRGLERLKRLDIRLEERVGDHQVPGNEPAASPMSR
jgi:hypothetical protein